jgi:hypothetical protein
MDGSIVSNTQIQIRSLWRLEWIVSAYAVILIATSIAMFMMGNTSAKVSDYITQQNDAALKLWANLDYFGHHRLASDPLDKSLPPGLFESVVEFSRTTANIMKTVHRLSPQRIFSPGLPLGEFLQHLKPTDGSQPEPGKAAYFDHLGIDARTDASNIVSQSMYQIELYQAVRDYAQDEAGFYKDCLGAVSVYVMPVLYALLGAFLWAFRSLCQRVHTHGDDPSPDRSSRFVMAAIAGIAISSISTLFPKDVLLSPLAIAFVFGYSIDIFTSRLDAYIATLTKRGASQEA